MMQAPKEQFKLLEKVKLMRQNGLYNLVRLKTHLQDEGILDMESIQDLIIKFTAILSTCPLMQETSLIL